MIGLLRCMLMCIFIVEVVCMYVCVCVCMYGEYKNECVCVYVRLLCQPNNLL